MDFLISIWEWLHEYVQYTIYNGVKALIILLPLFIVVAYYTYAERKVIGYMQIRMGPNRVGPKGLLQPFADMFKLMFKEIIIPTNSNRYLFIIAPVITFAPAMAAWAVIPFDRHAGVRRHQRRPAVHPGDDVGRRLRRHHRRLGVEFEIRAAWRDALGRANSRL